jgi:hypothetical protein
MRYLTVLACLLILAGETPADVVTFPGAVAEGYSAVSEVKGDLELPEAKARTVVEFFVQHLGCADGGTASSMG